jgi:hypothetical protein
MACIAVHNPREAFSPKPVPALLSHDRQHHERRHKRADGQPSVTVMERDRQHATCKQADK